MNRKMNVFLAFSIVVFFVVIGIFAGSAAARPDNGDPEPIVYLPLLTAPFEPVDSYDVGFSDDIEPWVAARWKDGATFDVDHSDDCVDGRCGFLDTAVTSKNAYVIASPLIPGPTRSYAITFRAKLQDRQNNHTYGAVFSGDAAGVCPGDNATGCFNQYYEFLARFQNEGGDEVIEYRVRRITYHDSDNTAQGDTVIDWTPASGVDAGDWIKWEIRFRSSGTIYIKANNLEQAGEGRSSHLTDQRFFGLITRTDEHGDGHVIFDNYKIEKD